MSTFGERLKYLRKHNRYTQDELATILFLDKSSISKYENNRNIPENDVLTRMADLFNVSIDYLLCRTNNPNLSLIEGTLNGKPFKAEVESKNLNIDGVELDMDEFDNFIKLLKQSFVDVKSVAEASKNK